MVIDIGPDEPGIGSVSHLPLGSDARDYEVIKAHQIAG